MIVNGANCFSKNKTRLVTLFSRTIFIGQKTSTLAKTKKLFQIDVLDKSKDI